MTDAQWVRIAQWQAKMTPRLEARAKELLDSFANRPPRSQAEWDARVSEAELAVRAVGMHVQAMVAHRDRLANAIAGIGPDGKPFTYQQLADELEKNGDLDV